MKRILSTEQNIFMSEELERLENFLYASGMSPKQVQIATLYLQGDLIALLQLGIQVLEVDRESFLSLFERSTADERRSSC